MLKSKIHLGEGKKLVKIALISKNTQHSLCWSNSLDLSLQCGFVAE